MIQLARIVGQADEEFRPGAVGRLGAGQGHGAAQIVKPVIGLQRHRHRLVAAALHVRFPAAHLDHEARGDPVDHRAVIMPGLHIFHHIGDALGGVFAVQLQGDVAHGGGNQQARPRHRRIGQRRRCSLHGDGRRRRFSRGLGESGRGQQQEGEGGQAHDDLREDAHSSKLYPTKKPGAMARLLAIHRLRFSAR